MFGLIKSNFPVLAPMRQLARPMRLVVAALCGAFVGVGASVATASEPRVVVDILPTHGLATALMKGVGTPELLLDQRQSPHVSALRPSRVQHLQAADIVFWIGPGMTSTLTRPIAAIADPDKIVALGESPDLYWQALLHGDHHDHAGHDDHDHAKHDDHDDHDHAKHDDHDDHDDHADEAEARDWHVWLDPHNAAVMAAMMAEELIQRDPAHAAIYRANLTALVNAINETDMTVMAMVATASSAHNDTIRYVTVHDAYGYLAGHYGVQPGGALSLGHEVTYSPRDVANLRKVIADDGADCLLTDLDTPPSLQRLLADDTSLRVVQMDPLGWDVPMDENHYPTLLANLGKGLVACVEE